MINVLLDMNITGNITKFIHNFLKKRYIKVCINGMISNKFELENGVPQGSILSVTLFLVAINSLINRIKPPAQANFFADDGNICI